MAGSYACARVTPITVWIVLKNDSIACKKIRWYLHYSGDASDHCSLFSQTFYGLLISYLTTLYHKFPVSLLLYIATKKTCQINQIVTVNSSMNALISETS